MRLAPLFLVLLIGLWALLAASAWALAGIWSRRGPRLGALAVAVAAALAGGFVWARLGPGGGSGLLLSLLLVPLLGLLVTVAIQR
jgi:hypothetical protein